MPLGSSMQVSASGLTAERLRLDVISNNLANVNTTRGADGLPYRRQEVIFAARQGGDSFAARLASARGGRFAQGGAGAGVQVSEIRSDMSSFKVIHDRDHPDADAQGNVKMPNIEPIIEMVDMMAATRAYEGGVTAITAAKQMQQRALDIGR
jgi:flagellar basal-body rod protein FlgC